tara:strand:+ start:415 stop:897 length:483 start_codon:yes stop_codon:yes gene_type:complete
MSKSKNFGIIETNPISVSGVEGTITYLDNLRVNGKRIIFHRLGCYGIDSIDNMLDHYEIVSIDGKFWGDLYFDMYHSCNLNILPDDKRYSWHRYSSATKVEDLKKNFGTNAYCDNFPFDVPNAMEEGGRGLMFDTDLKILSNELKSILSNNEFKKRRKKN